jgi:hypothetical protein
MCSPNLYPNCRCTSLRFHFSVGAKIPLAPLSVERVLRVGKCLQEQHFHSRHGGEGTQRGGHRNPKDEPESPSSCLDQFLSRPN